MTSVEDRASPSRSELNAQVRAILSEVVPDKDISTIRDDADLEQALGVDSMALVDFVLELERETGITVADQDLLRLTSIDAIVDYVAAARTSAE
jgi:acyl carrier protein